MQEVLEGVNQVLGIMQLTLTKYFLKNFSNSYQMLALDFIFL